MYSWVAGPSPAMTTKIEPKLGKQYMRLPIALALLTLLAVPAMAQQGDADYYTAYFNRLDQDKDGSFTLSDLQRISAKEFKRTDDDKNGTLSLDEFVYGIPAARQDVLARFTKRFTASDADGNGEITPAEDDAYCRHLVEAADTDQDGKVTLPEYLAVNGGAQ